jgi:hypothetical protein
VLAEGLIPGELQAHTASAPGGLPMLPIPRTDRTRVERALDQVTRELGPRNLMPIHQSPRGDWGAHPPPSPALP